MKTPNPGARSSETVLITGGARGLGLVLATIYAKRGATVVLCSRTKADLDEADAILRRSVPNPRVFTEVCDVSDLSQVERMIERAEEHAGPIDILVNDAGVIQNAPLESVTARDFEDSLDSNLRGMVNCSFTVLPKMIQRRRGRILNVTSVGGVIPVPQLMSYSTAKFGAVGFSTSFTLAARRHGIRVTTAVPFLMRTGSFLHARFRGEEKKAMSLFTLMSTLPIVTLSAERAASKMVRACDRGQGFVVLGAAAKLARLGFAAAPNLALTALGLVDRFLPGSRTTQAPIAFATNASSRSGAEIETASGIHAQTATGERAAQRWNERTTR